MEVIFLVGASQAFFLAFLVFGKKNKSTGDYVLSLWLAFIGLHLLNHYLLTTGFLFRYPHLLGIGIAFPMLQGPFLFIYILVMINKSGKFKPVYWLHAIPFLIFNLYFMFDFYFLSAPEKLAYYELKKTEPSLILLIMSFPNMIIAPIYVIWSLFKLRKHMKNIADNFSYTEQINLNWLKYVLVGIGFVSVIVMSANVLVESLPILSDGMHNHIIYLSATIAVFFLGYFGIKQQAIYINPPAIKNKKDSETTRSMKKEGVRYEHSSLKKTEAEKHLKKLLDYIENEKPYLNGKLSLKEVAEYIDVSVNHLSQVINEQLGKSFFDFVNEYRIREVKFRLSDSKNKQYTLLAIAYDSGFNSKSSFNNIFKKFTGITPTQYIKQQAA
jgi:AraC-like DNA-binding protein